MQSSVKLSGISENFQLFRRARLIEIQWNKSQWSDAISIAVIGGPLNHQIRLTRWLMKSYETFLSARSAIIPFMLSTSSSLLSFAAALKTQPYDLLRWSAAYFRCLSLDVLPPVKPRYEHENVFGCLTKGYLKVLLSQVSRVWEAIWLTSCYALRYQICAFQP